MKNFQLNGISFSAHDVALAASSGGLEAVLLRNGEWIVGTGCFEDEKVFSDLENRELFLSDYRYDGENYYYSWDYLSVVSEEELLFIYPLGDKQLNVFTCHSELLCSLYSEEEKVALNAQREKEIALLAEIFGRK